MNKLKIYTWLLLLLINKITFASDWGIFWKNMWDKLKKWDKITLGDIPNMIKNMIEFFISIAWTIAVIFVIVWAYKILFGSLQQDKTKWKDTIIMALWGFVIATLAWFIVQFIFDNFTNI
jgi:RsiW-degrading membrane proteinase PrsW (M82 family)